MAAVPSDPPETAMKRKHNGPRTSFLSFRLSNWIRTQATFRATLQYLPTIPPTPFTLAYEFRPPTSSGFIDPKDPDSKFIVPLDWGLLQSKILSRPEPQIKKVRFVLFPKVREVGGESVKTIESAARLGMPELSSKGLLFFHLDKRKV